MKKIVLICLDGATWDVIDPLIRKGELPNLNKLKDCGSYGDLMSMQEKLISPVIWMGIATGKRPEKHGIKDFFSTESEVKCLRFWEILSQRGFSYGLYNFFHTWPPNRKSAFCVPGVLAPGVDTYPEQADFVKRIKEDRKKGDNLRPIAMMKCGIKALNMGLRISTIVRMIGLIVRLKSRNSSFIERYPFEKTLELYLSTDLFCHLCNNTKPDVTVFYENGGDLISHYFWEEWEDNGTNKKGKVYEYYKHLDRAIGHLLKKIPHDSHIFLVSDHGMQSIRRGARVMSMKIERLLSELGVSDKVYGQNIGYDCYLRAKKDNTDENMMQKIEEKVRSIRFKEIQFPLMKIIKTSNSELEFSFNQKEVNRELIKNNNLIINEDSKLVAWNSTYRAEDLIDLKPKQTGKHHKKGIFLAKGPNIRANMKIEEASIYDITPTILRLMEQPTVRDMDGKVLVDIFSDEFLEKSPERFIESHETTGFIGPKREITKEEEEYLKEQLRNMGYLS